MARARFRNGLDYPICLPTLLKVSRLTDFLVCNFHWGILKRFDYHVGGFL